MPCVVDPGTFDHEEKSLWGVFFEQAESLGDHLSQSGLFEISVDGVVQLKGGRVVRGGEKGREVQGKHTWLMPKRPRVGILEIALN
jgi:hypothetical protein